MNNTRKTELQNLGLTKKQISAYETLLLFFKEKGHAPTLKEWCEFDGSKKQSLNSYQQYIHVFESKGLITRTGKKRGIVLKAFVGEKVGQDALRILGFCITKDSIGFETKEGFKNFELIEALEIYEKLTTGFVIHKLHYKNKCALTQKF